MGWLGAEGTSGSGQSMMDSRSVSPIIAVILVVAVVVILAAVTSTFVLGLGESVSDPGPTAAFEAQQVDHQTVVFTHRSGDPIDATNLSISDGEIIQAPETVTAGETIRADTFSLGEVKLVFDGGERSRILRRTTLEPVVSPVNGTGDPPTDTNGDGFLDDITGTGEPTSDGPNLISEYVVGNVSIEMFEKFPEYFDFNCDDDVAIGDAQAHKEVYLDETDELPKGCEGPA